MERLTNHIIVGFSAANDSVSLLTTHFLKTHQIIILFFEVLSNGFYSLLAMTRDELESPVQTLAIRRGCLS